MMPEKLPSDLHVHVPPPTYPSAQVTLTVLPVMPLIESATEKYELATWVDAHALAPHSAPEKAAFALHVHVPPPVYPASQTTDKVSPVLPAMDP